MPVPVPNPSIVCETFRKASEIPTRVWDAMRKDPRSNIILPTADKSLLNERKSLSLSNDECWIVCSTTSSRQPDFVLTVTNGAIDTYPIFLWTPRAAKELTNAFLAPRIQKLVWELRKQVKDSRVFSVFALDAVTNAFAECWSIETGIDVVREPYYHANYSYCDRASLAAEGRDNKADADTILRRATLSDLDQTSELCRSFAAESEPFVLSTEDARHEAELYTTQQQLWVYEHKPTGAITCIVAVTRKSTGVAAITKVYTHPSWRGRKCAAKLVRRVTDEVLDSGFSRVCLYVAHSNEPASRVYHRVGYKGLFAEDGLETPLVESWLELGFDRKRVELGHW
ncbi:acyl-CoA N-acyltransferase [Schizopora paradoxa]|uniref:Acyl-CoA N-acyltransferase n=1 Tax=Schizopora paradoxa TaxID=27342 RepID=A0A0H2RF80_9AGAM|nr:acyl-CoA N-acyltransferase [Schizopora paradoxa]